MFTLSTGFDHEATSVDPQCTNTISARHRTIRSRVTAISPFPIWALSAILDLTESTLLTIPRPPRLHFLQTYWIWYIDLRPRLRYAPSRKFYIDDRSQFISTSGSGFDMWPPLRTDNAPVYRISTKSANAWLNYCNSTNFSGPFFSGGGEWHEPPSCQRRVNRMYQIWRVYRPIICTWAFAL